MRTKVSLFTPLFTISIFLTVFLAYLTANAMATEKPIYKKSLSKAIEFQLTDKYNK